MKSDRLLPVIIDFESMSKARLKDIGGRNYWDDPSTVPICCGWHDIRTDERGMWTPGQKWRFAGRTLAAHNMSFFDRFGCIKLGWMPADDHGWIDTSEWARSAGLPGKLDELAKRWLGRRKDAAGNRLVKSFSLVKRPKDFPMAVWRTLNKEERQHYGVLADIPKEKLERAYSYCNNDVGVLSDSFERLEVFADEEPDVVAADRMINDRGMRFDVDLAKALLECDAHRTSRRIKSIAKELGYAPSKVRRLAMSPKALIEYIDAPNVTKKTIADILSRPKDFDRQTVLLAQARQAVASIVGGKLRAGLTRLSSDGRLHDMFRIYGAHTWRWGGSGFQPHNLTKPGEQFKKWSVEQIDALAWSVVEREHEATAPESDLLLRACLIPTDGHQFAVVDWSGIEARALAWASNDRAALEVFRSGADPYRVMAAKIFGGSPEGVSDDQRQIGKRVVLACGYQMGWRTFKARCLADGVDLSVMGLSAREVVDAWRDLHAPSVRLWYALQRAMILAAGGHASKVSCFEFVPINGKDIAVFLPSGRAVVYPDVRVSHGRRGPQISYLGTKGREHIYGGKITENLIQALCRDLLANALARLNKQRANTVLHVHDEIGVEVPGTKPKHGKEGMLWLRNEMLILPDWARGLPVDASGYYGNRIRKG